VQIEKEKSYNRRRAAGGVSDRERDRPFEAARGAGSRYGGLPSFVSSHGELQELRVLRLKPRALLGEATESPRVSRKVKKLRHCRFVGDRLAGEARIRTGRKNDIPGVQK